MSADDSIVLQVYSDQWPKLAADEIKRIRSSIPALLNKRIEHVGSTSVPGLSAKPILDLVVEVTIIQEGSVAIDPLESMGYSYWRENPDQKHMFFVKGLPPQGKGRTHHVHFFETERFNEHIRFRDALRSNSQLAQEYQELKIQLAGKFRHDREGYTKAKSSFIETTLESSE